MCDQCRELGIPEDLPQPGYGETYPEWAARMIKEGVDPETPLNGETIESLASYVDITKKLQKAIQEEVRKMEKQIFGTQSVKLEGGIKDGEVLVIKADMKFVRFMSPVLPDNFDGLLDAEMPTEIPVKYHTYSPTGRFSIDGYAIFKYDQ